MKSTYQTGTAFTILSLLAVCHMLNDTLQSVISAVYPLLKDSLLLNFTQIGLITLVFQLSSSIFQPIVGIITDKKPQPYSLLYIIIEKGSIFYLKSIPLRKDFQRT